MAKVAVPVTRLQYDDGNTFPSDVIEEMMRLGFWHDDELTFTGRIKVPDVSVVRQRTAQRLKMLLPNEQAERLIALLDANDWDVSFFVDCW